MDTPVIVALIGLVGTLLGILLKHHLDLKKERLIRSETWDDHDGDSVFSRVLEWSRDQIVDGLSTALMIVSMLLFLMALSWVLTFLGVI